MNRFIPALATACLALSAATAFAQAPSERRGPDQAQRQQMKERFEAAREACKGAADQRACMTQNFCAKSPNPAMCQEEARARGEHMKARMEKRQQMHEACNGKRGADLESCLKAQHQAFKQVRLEQRQKAHEACNAKRGEELFKCLREQPGGFGGHGGHGGHGGPGQHGMRM